MKKFEDRGITLVALVVTIIVLIILAGVSISLVLGQDGVVQKAKQGRDSYAEAAKLENEQLAKVDAFAMTVQEMTPSTSTVRGEITNMTDGEIEISATVNLDGDIDFTKTKYVFTTGSNPLGTNDESLYKDGIIEQASSSVSATKAAGTYYLHVFTTSTNGAKREIISEETATSQGKKDFDYTGSVQDITLTPGNYKLEVWGASGGCGQTGSIGNLSYEGKGGYSIGTYAIDSKMTLYAYVGGKGTYGYSNLNGGWNGGGGSYCYVTPSSSYPAVSGGGATDFSIVGGDCILDTTNLRYVRTQESYNGRIIVAGGGGSSAINGNVIGGHGGGTSGTNSPSSTENSGYSAGTQSSAGNCSGTSGKNSSSGYLAVGGLGYGASGKVTNSSSTQSAGAGGGYYGGGTSPASNSNASAGGSGYINTSLLTNAQTIAGNQQFTSPTGTNETGHSGNGYARITALD